tara:strand:- start:4821 stop:5120 length:300 start_codon:yes stop_codon:yes gene_type:complete
MLKKTLNPEKLKVKYILENHSSLKTYPDPEDILYEYIRDYCNRPKATKIEFTDVSLKKYYNLTDEKASEIISFLVDKGFLKEVRGNSAYSTYQIIKNPY